MNRRVVGAAAALIAAVLVMTSTLVARWWHGPMTGATIESKDDAGAPVRMAYNRSVEIRIGTLRAHRCNTKGEQRCDGSAHLDKTPTGFAVAGLATMGAGIMAGLAVAVVALCWLLRASVWRRRLAMVALVLLGLQVIAVVAFWLQVPNDVVFDRVHVDYDVGWGISSMLFVVGVPLAIGLMIFSMRAAELAAVRVPAAAPPLDLARASAAAACWPAAAALAWPGTAPRAA